jgi:hypothetical protein
MEWRGRGYREGSVRWECVGALEGECGGCGMGMMAEVEVSGWRWVWSALLGL